MGAKLPFNCLHFILVLLFKKKKALFLTRNFLEGRSRPLKRNHPTQKVLSPIGTGDQNLTLEIRNFVSKKKKKKKTNNNNNKKQQLIVLNFKNEFFSRCGDTALTYDTYS